MKKILIINQAINQTGGQEMHTVVLANGLSRSGHDVSILTLKTKQNDLSILSDGISVISYKRLKIFDQVICFELFKKTYKELINKQDAVIINNPLSLFAMQCYFNSDIKNIITVFHSKMYSPNKLKRMVNQYLRQVFMYFALSKSDKLVFLTKSDRVYFSNISPIVTNIRSYIIPNGIFHIKADKKHIVNKYKKYINILFVGRIKKSKGVADLIQVSKRFENFDSIMFHFVGAGPLAEELVHCKNCNYHGVKSKSELAAIYAMADIFVLPSYSESFPLTIIEAMFAGLPVITTDIFGLREIVGENNILVKSGDIDSLTRAIKFLITDEKARRIIGISNKKYARKNYSGQQMTKRYNNLLMCSKL